MEDKIIEISRIRLSKAKDNLKVCEDLMEKGYYSFSMNRAYYALFDAIRAVNALDGFDSSKHSGVIAHFNQFHIKTGDFDSSFSVTIKQASFFREKADYDDFFSAEEKDASRMLSGVREFIESVDLYLSERLGEYIDNINQ